MKYLTNFVKRPNGELLDSAKTDCRYGRRSNPSSFCEFLLGHVCVCEQGL
nr:MAG TPA: hypothetical protein [Caudoviricetes sp.]